MHGLLTEPKPRPRYRAEQRAYALALAALHFPVAVLTTVTNKYLYYTLIICNIQPPRDYLDLLFTVNTIQ